VLNSIDWFNVEEFECMVRKKKVPQKDKRLAAIWFETNR